MKFNVETTLSAAAIALVTSVAGAQAATVNLVNEGANAWGSPSWAQSATITYGGTSKGVGAGLMRLVDSGTGQSFKAFCVDVFHVLGSVPGAYETTNTSWFSQAVTSNITKLYNTAYAAVDSAVEAAGFQLALWEIVTETNGTLDIDSGYFSVNGTVAAEDTARGYLAGLNGVATGNYDLTFLMSVKNPQGQHLIEGNPNVDPVPLPATALLLMGGLAGLGGFARKARRKA